MIQVMRPKLPSVQQLEPYLLRIDEARNYSNRGQLVQELETRIADLLKVDPNLVIAVSNGSAGIHVLAQALEIERIRVPDYTFAGSALPLLQAGSHVFLSDVNAKAVLSISSESNLDSMASLVVAPFGEVNDLPKDSQLKGPLIWDLAGALGNCLEGKFSLKGRHAVFSLHATKIIGAGEGGLVIAGDTSLAEDIRARINFGFAGSRESSMLGHNFKMSEFSAAVALGSLDQFYESTDPLKDKWLRQRNMSKMMEQDFKLIGFAHHNSITPYWVIDTGDSEVLGTMSRVLEKSGIETRKWWPSALSDMLSFGRHQKFNPNSIRFASTHLGLPFSVDMNDEEWDQISESLNKLKGVSN